MTSTEKTRRIPRVGVTYDGPLDIATAPSSRSVKWKNQTVNWSELVVKLQKFRDTGETWAEYQKMSKDEKARRKDVGGFVGGYLREGRRKNGYVGYRTLLTYDLDDAERDPEVTLDPLLADAGVSSAVYSTHSHSDEHPRLRVLFPLSREVNPEEYEAVARKFAEQLGIMPRLDKTTFQPTRLMYWPSKATDADEYSEVYDGPWLDVDKVLASYPEGNWQDRSCWPRHPDEKGDEEEHKKRVERQQDPREKNNVVGAFCRAYTVPEAIDAFLSDLYVVTDERDPNRYTYVPGSSAGGMVIYDDGLFCYSNHATDPAGEQDLNAFDLVRIHLFGDKDGDKTYDNSTKAPSYEAMCEFVWADTKVLAEDDARREARLREDFDLEEEEDDKEDRSWKKGLQRNQQTGNIMANMDNLKLIFDYHQRLQGLQYNILTESITIDPEYPVPWRRKNDRGPWTNADEERLFCYLSRYATFQRSHIQACLTEYSHQRSYDPVIDYLEALPEWDGVKRCETLFIDYLGAEDAPDIREATMKWLTATVRRVLTPGCKFDYMPVLSGPPGIGKSTLAARLGGDWFTDSLTFDDMKDKTAAEKLAGAWICEISELSGMRKMDVETIKSFLSRTEDRYRPAYGRYVETKLRRNSFVGTSNDNNYLRDVTGNRRFWPIPVTGNGTKDPITIPDSEIQQIWAEALVYARDESIKLYLSRESAARMCERQQDSMEQDDRAGIVEEYLNVVVPKDWDEQGLEERLAYLDSYDPKKAPKDGYVRNETSNIEIWCECFRESKNRLNAQRDGYAIRAIMQSLGWVKSGDRKYVPIYGRQRVYRRP